MTDFIENFCGDSNSFSDMDIDTQAVNKAALKTVLPLIMKYELTDRQKSCLKMKYVNELTQEEIAERLQLSQPTVSRHLVAAKSIVSNRLSYCLTVLNKANSMWLNTLQ